MHVGDFHLGLEVDLVLDFVADALAGGLAVLAQQHEQLVRKLRGHNDYYGLPGNFEALSRFRYEVGRLWRKWLDRRSDKACMTWERFNRLLKRYPLPSHVVRYGLVPHAANP